MLMLGWMPGGPEWVVIGTIVLVPVAAAGVVLWLVLRKK